MLYELTGEPLAVRYNTRFYLPLLLLCTLRSDCDALLTPLLHSTLTLRTLFLPQATRLRGRASFIFTHPSLPSSPLLTLCPYLCPPLSFSLSLSIFLLFLCVPISPFCPTLSLSLPPFLFLSVPLPPLCPCTAPSSLNLPALERRAVSVICPRAAVHSQRHCCESWGKGSCVCGGEGGE